jgi:hypothetical protein
MLGGNRLDHSRIRERGWYLPKMDDDANCNQNAKKGSQPIPAQHRTRSDLSSSNFLQRAAFPSTDTDALISQHPV